MAYYSTAQTFDGRHGGPHSLFVKLNGGSLTLDWNFSGAGAGGAAQESITSDGHYRLQMPVSTSLTITPAGGAEYEFI